jgi:hypothetical protein
MPTEYKRTFSVPLRGRQALSNPCADTDTTNHQPPSDPRPRAETKQLCAGRHNFSACRTQSHRSYGDDEGEVHSLVRVLGLHREESDKHGKVLWSIEAALTLMQTADLLNLALRCVISFECLPCLVDVAQQGAYLS